MDDVTVKEAANCKEIPLGNLCNLIRDSIECIKRDVVLAVESSEFYSEDSLLKGMNIPMRRHANMKANLTLAFRHLEDARMRIGKVMQAYQGGISILDKK